jgi:tRNA pseudouridine38-40 synthase
VRGGIERGEGWRESSGVARGRGNVPRDVAQSQCSGARGALRSPLAANRFPAMAERSVQLVLQYDGAGFSGWQRQPDQRTVQGVVEEALERLCGTRIAALGSGRTDAGVHARGQSVGVRIDSRWDAPRLRRALNAILPPDIWVETALEMQPAFHARYSATSRRYQYLVGTDGEARSPFRRRWELACDRPLDPALLTSAAQRIEGDHCFRAFAVRGTAPAHDTHHCRVFAAQWTPRPGGLAFDIEANRFLHHMVRFLVGTMLDIAIARRPLSDLDLLLEASDNREVSPPVSPHALYLLRVRYPRELYLNPDDSWSGQ